MSFSFLPHDRSLFFETQEYKKSVFSFFEKELQNDGIDITAQFSFSLQKKLDTISSAYVIAKEDGILAGKEEILSFFSRQYPKVQIQFLIDDGNSFTALEKIIIFSGNASDILKIERVILNTLSRMSGIATMTKNLQEKSETPLAATRKTQWSYLDKKAVFVAGGLTHRMGLFDAILIKENHRIINGYNSEIFSDENVKTFLLQSEKEKHIAFIEVEVETEQEFEEIFKIFWKRKYLNISMVIMLDNFSSAEIKKIISSLPSLKERHFRKIFIEISGGITEKNLEIYSHLGADVISMGALTHSVIPIDFSLRFVE